jgi:hypothetical protein
VSEGVRKKRERVSEREGDRDEYREGRRESVCMSRQRQRGKRKKGKRE